MWKIGAGITMGFFVARYLYLNDLVGPRVEAAIESRERMIKEKLGRLLHDFELPEEEVEMTLKEVMS